MSKIYEQHDAAFKHVSAFVVVSLGSRKIEPERVATIAFKFPRDGAGRLYCYLHVFGGPMVRGFATGGGYDKKSAAAQCAAQRLKMRDYRDENRADVEAVRKALGFDDGTTWDAHLRREGFHVFQAV